MKKPKTQLPRSGLPEVLNSHISEEFLSGLANPFPVGGQGQQLSGAPITMPTGTVMAPKGDGASSEGVGGFAKP